MNSPYLEVEHYTAERIPNLNPGGELPWHLYHTVRNAMVQCCRKHGPTGSMGFLPFDPKRPVFDILSWERGDRDPWYWIIDDQYNEERYLYAELYGNNPLTMDWLSDVTNTLEEFAGWGLCISNIPESYLIIFDRKLMVNVELFASVKTADEVRNIATQQLHTRGSA